MLATATAHMDAEFVRQGPQPALEGADDAGGDAGRMPVHAHDGAERLKPERMRQPLQEFVAAVMMDDSLADNCAKQGHAFSQPRRNTPAVKRKIGAACSSCHNCLIWFLRCRNVTRDQRFSKSSRDLGSGNSG